MKQILKVLLCWTCCLSAVGIPFEENLSILSLDNGIEVWLKHYDQPSHAVSCRVIARNPLEAVPQIFSLDCPLDAFEEELPYFVELCRESIINEAQCKLAVVAVGDFEERSLREFLGAAFEVFSQRTIPQVQMITVNSSADTDMIDVSLSYPTAFQELKTDQDLKKLWMLYLLHSVVEERFRKIVKSVDGQWIPFEQAKYLLPYSNAVAKGRQMRSDEPGSMLSAFLVAMQEIKSSGFNDQELADAKAKLQKNLINFYHKKPNNNILADYLASHCAFGAGHPDYSIFMTMSFKAIAEIENTDVLSLIQGYFQDETRHVEMTIPTSVHFTAASVQQALDQVKVDGVIFRPYQKESEKDPAQSSTYSQLTMTDEEAKMIYKIIDTVGNTFWAKLIFKRGELQDLGIKVQHVHPFKFLETVLTDPHLKKSMEYIEESTPKWGGFLDGSGNAPGFVAKCNREADRNNFAPHIVGFCQVVKANPEQVRTFVEKREWGNLVKFLITLEN